ncbi:MAG: acetyl-CoA hydrolase [Pseudomonadales bacterium]|nr:acetyl-CoA hydrolase [Pseudomonadales bacterium]
MTELLTSVEECVDRAIARVGKNLVLMAPLGLGKPVQVVNAFYNRALADPGISLHIYTALCLERPPAASGVEAALSGPIMQRLFGDYEELAFIEPVRNGTLPANIQVSEMYFKAGSMKGVHSAQRNYISSNYTHIARDMFDAGANVLVQLVAARDTPAGLSVSLSCNPDTSMELIEMYAASDKPCISIGQIHADLPYMENDAEIGVDAIDLLVRNPQYDKTLFAVPNTSVPMQDYATALHASTLVADGGTLQIGIGALGDAVAYSCILRQQHNSDYRAAIAAITHQRAAVADHTELFEQGLYVSTEMFVNGMMHLVENGVVKRKVYDNLALQLGLNSAEISTGIDERMYDYCRKQGLMPPRLDENALEKLKYWGILAEDLALAGDRLLLGSASVPNDMDDPRARKAILASGKGRELRHGRILHGGFFLGPADFYRKLRELDAAGQEQICMTGVRRTNQLLLDYPLYCAQRQKARFINTGMMVTLTGAVASDALEDGTVISGVGGQYNFVAMAHDLPGARSILCIRSTRGSGKQLKSNIVPFYGHITIPKHLRDVIVTEYGVADLRGQSDSEIIKRLLNIADSRFQAELQEFAVSHGKLEADYRIPREAQDNTPERLRQALAPLSKKGLLPAYPFGTDLTEQELALAASLRKIKALSEEPAHFVSAAFKAILHHGDETAAAPYLERIQLEHPETTRDFIIQQLLMLELEEQGMFKVS